MVPNAILDVTNTYNLPLYTIEQAESSPSYSIPAMQKRGHSLRNVLFSDSI